MGSPARKRSGLFGIFGKKSDPNERQPGQKLPTPTLVKTAKLDKRAISGQRVICICSMQLPKVDAFSQLRTHRKGLLIFNIRGGALYLSDQFTEDSIPLMFNPGEPGIIKNFKLYPRNRPVINVGDIAARFLKFTNSTTYPGLVMRFGNLSEEQLIILDGLVNELPKVGGDEKNFLLKSLTIKKKAK